VYSAARTYRAVSAARRTRGRKEMNMFKFNEVGVSTIEKNVVVLYAEALW
jgi:hypothetical protein